MRLGSDALLQIVDIVRDGLASGKDISQGLRDLDLQQEPVVLEEGQEATLVLSARYKAERGR